VSRRSSLGLALLVAGPACRDEARERPNILVIDIDTLRADRIGLERNGEELTPNIDALARRSVRFEQMIAQGGWTLPSLAALLTGRHAVGALRPVPAEEVAWIPPGARTIAEILSLYDYETAVFYGSTVPAGLPPFASGFSFVGPRPELGGAAHASREPIAWLRSGPPTPWFVFVHDVDLHLLGEIPRESLDRFATVPERYVPPRDLDYARLVKRWSKDIGLDAARELLVAHYDAAVAHHDEEVGKLIRAVPEDTVIVLTSDHGQELFERGHFDHGPPYDFDLRVPLVIHVPGGAPRVESRMVQTVDLAPTILELAGIPADATMAGVSLVPLLGGPGQYVERPAFSITDPHRVSVRTPDHHMVRCGRSDCARGAGGGEPLYELYAPPSDPREEEDLVGRGLGAERELRELVDRFVVDGLSAAAGPGSGVLGEELRERGYWGQPETEAPGAETAPGAGSAGAGQSQATE
jgi:arylsulfatase A-like enzyme